MISQCYIWTVRNVANIQKYKDAAKLAVPGKIKYWETHKMFW
jgi:hypothetical protein